MVQPGTAATRAGAAAGVGRYTRRRGGRRPRASETGVPPARPYPGGMHRDVRPPPRPRLGDAGRHRDLRRADVGGVRLQRHLRPAGRHRPGSAPAGALRRAGRGRDGAAGGRHGDRRGRGRGVDGPGGRRARPAPEAPDRRRRGRGQTLLTFVAPHLPSPEAYTAWLIATAVALGVGVPVTFSLTVDLVPVRRRGLAAGAVTAVAYAFAPLASGDWTIEPLAAMFGIAMVGGTIVLAALGWLDLAWVGHLARQHARPAFGRAATSGPTAPGARGCGAACSAPWRCCSSSSSSTASASCAWSTPRSTWPRPGARSTPARASRSRSPTSRPPPSAACCTAPWASAPCWRGSWAPSRSCTSATRSTPGWGSATAGRWASRCCTPSPSASTPSSPSRSGPTSPRPTRSACTPRSAWPPRRGPRPSSPPRSPCAGPRPGWRSSGTWRWSTA
jgi:hypothetical protein